MATIRDVARASKVSVATVSRVFNENPRVSESTRLRVVAVASRLGYWPNPTARSLITNRTHAIGVLLPDLHGEFFSEVIRGIDSATRERQLHLLLSSFNSTPDDLMSAIRTVRGRVDGLIVMSPDLDASIALQPKSGGAPTVLLNPEVEVPGCDSLSIANFEGAHAMVGHLLRLGHRRVAMIRGPERNIDARQRLEGYRAALREVGLPNASDMVLDGDFTEHSGYEAMQGLLRRPSRPTAIFVANDHMAIGVLGALQDAGIRVPLDMAVTGFDDIPLARYLTPPLTTVHVDMLQLGRRAVDLLLDRREPAGETRHAVLPTTLVVRSSCGTKPPRQAGSRVRWERRHAVAVTPRGGLKT
jgi:LacI family transcriptional regulator